MDVVVIDSYTYVRWMHAQANNISYYRCMMAFVYEFQMKSKLLWH